MKQEHIIELLERGPLDQLSAADRERVRSHTGDCAACRRAYDAAWAATRLVKARNAETIEPSPFFKTRVMAAIRERQLSPAGSPLVRAWRAAGWLVSGMAAAVVLLAAVSFSNLDAPSTSLTTQTAALAADAYSVESIVLSSDDLDRELTNGQVLNAIYEPSAEGGNEHK